MDRVWIVVDRIDYHGSEVVGVFATRAEAEKWSAERNAAKRATDHAEVIEWPVGAEHAGNERQPD